MSIATSQSGQYAGTYLSRSIFFGPTFELDRAATEYHVCGCFFCPF